jgi:ADP-ribosylglycohydrolase
MLALLDSLLRERAPGEARFDTTDQAKRFLAWRDDRDYTPDHNGMFDIGNATSSAINRFRSGTAAEKSGGTGERDQGNGSLMRILPIALVERDLPDPELVAAAHRSSRVTHGHSVPQAACALYVLVARNLLRGQARAVAMNNARTELRHVYEQHAKTELWLGALETLEGWSARSGRGYVVDSFWSAWDAVVGAKSYQDAVVRAVKYGGDTDTTACIAGGLAGLRWGVGGIPTEWRTTLRGQDIVMPLVAALVGDPAAPVTPAASPAEPAPPGSRTSDTHPIRVDWVDQAAVPAAAGWTGELGMTLLPGKKDSGLAGQHWRDLESDVARLADDWHTDTFVLLVQDRDLKATKVPKRALVESMAAHRIDLIRYPIVDGGVPSDMASFAELLATIEERLRSGQRVVVACRGGLGRTGTVVGCLLRDSGLTGAEAIAVTRKSRRKTIENAEQETFVLSWTPSASS